MLELETFHSYLFLTAAQPEPNSRDITLLGIDNKIGKAALVKFLLSRSCEEREGMDLNFQSIELCFLVSRPSRLACNMDSRLPSLHLLNMSVN